MEKYILIYLLLLSSILTAQEDKNISEDVFFTAEGSSPDWYLTINNNSKIKFTSDNKEKIFNYSAEKEILEKNNFPIPNLFGGFPKPLPAGWKYTSGNKNAKIKISVMLNSGKDIKEDSKYYSVKVIVKDIKKKKTRTYKGHGFYSADKKLESIWVIKKIFGRDFKQSQYTKDSTFIAFSIDKHSSFGLAGCNTYSIETYIRGSLITFGGITTTTMMCDNYEDESKFLGAICGKDIKYKIENDYLYLIDEDKTVLEFEKKRK